MIVRGEERRLKKRVIKIFRNKEEEEEEERVKIKTKVQVVCERKERERERGGSGKQSPLATVLCCVCVKRVATLS